MCTNISPSPIFTVPSVETKESTPSANLTLVVPTAVARTRAIFLTRGSVDATLKAVNASLKLPFLSSFLMSEGITPSNMFIYFAGSFEYSLNALAPPRTSSI